MTRDRSPAVTQDDRQAKALSVRRQTARRNNSPNLSARRSPQDRADLITAVTQGER